jgi:hypothetical protein
VRKHFAVRENRTTTRNIWRSGREIVTASCKKLIIPVRKFSNRYFLIDMQMGAYISRSNTVQPQRKQVDERSITNNAGNLKNYCCNMMRLGSGV